MALLRRVLCVALADVVGELGLALEQAVGHRRLDLGHRQRAHRVDPGQVGYAEAGRSSDHLRRDHLRRAAAHAPGPVRRERATRDDDRDRALDAPGEVCLDELVHHGTGQQADVGPGHQRGAAGELAAHPWRGLLVVLGDVRELVDEQVPAARSVRLVDPGREEDLPADRDRLGAVAAGHLGGHSVGVHPDLAEVVPEGEAVRLRRGRSWGLTGEHGVGLAVRGHLVGVLGRADRPRPVTRYPDRRRGRPLGERDRSSHIDTIPPVGQPVTPR
jgi:hypothetical protein